MFGRELAVPGFCCSDIVCAIEPWFRFDLAQSGTERTTHDKASRSPHEAGKGDGELGAERISSQLFYTASGSQSAMELAER